MIQKVPSFNSTQGLIKITETRAPFEYIEMQFVPQELNNTRNSKKSPIASMGANADIIQLTGGNETFTFQAEFDSVDGSFNVIEKVNWLKSLTMQPKRNVIVEFGGIFDGYVLFVDNVSAQYSLFQQRNGMRPRRALVTLTLSVDYSDELTLENIRNGNGS